jgi:thiol-disulfide isomerase/thioredoxin
MKIIYFLLIILSLSACDERKTSLENGTPAPSFTLLGLNGEKTNFPQDVAGKVTVIRFWADWCAACFDEMKEMKSIYSKYKNKGLEILAINVEQEREIVEAFVNDLNIHSYNILLDKDAKIFHKYRVIGLPTTFFVDRNGILKAKIVGESTIEVFERIVNEIL